MQALVASPNAVETHPPSAEGRSIWNDASGFRVVAPRHPTLGLREGAIYTDASRGDAENHCYERRYWIYSSSYCPARRNAQLVRENPPNASHASGRQNTRGGRDVRVHLTVDRQWTVG